MYVSYGLAFFKVSLMMVFDRFDNGGYEMVRVGYGHASERVDDMMGVRANVRANVLTT